MSVYIHNNTLESLNFPRFKFHFAFFFFLFFPLFFFLSLQNFRLCSTSTMQPNSTGPSQHAPGAILRRWQKGRRYNICTPLFFRSSPWSRVSSMSKTTSTSDVRQLHTHFTRDFISIQCMRNTHCSLIFWLLIVSMFCLGRQWRNLHCILLFYPNSIIHVACSNSESLFVFQNSSDYICYIAR
jgi:hypothetical protein